MQKAAKYAKTGASLVKFLTIIDLLAQGEGFELLIRFL